MTSRPGLPAKVAVLGAGSWGTTFAKVVARAHPEIRVSLWARRSEVAKEINEFHLNSQYLKDIRLPANLQAS
ncbi:glycerol-3-phosphate dehydrogenase, partial [Arthrobacter deserti]|nr:glycerol-3-phosphate dehydrogenase [Arthrobacter deserti]